MIGTGADLIFRRRTLFEKISYPFLVFWNWAYSNVHNAYGAYKVVDYILLHKLEAGLVRAGHPWVTGASPHTGRAVWPDNIVFASPRKTDWNRSGPAPDDEIVASIGRFLASMVERSTFDDPEIPQGPRRRMPHAVNYIHGTVHFNGGFLIFNDFPDAKFFLSDPRFVKEIKRFSKEEKRALTIVLRERYYDPEEYAWFVAFVRSHLPWYANGNSPTKKRVLWGAPSPYAAVNVINRSWITDLEKLRTGRLEDLIRPPIERSRYFRGVYQGNQPDYSFPERFHAWVMNLIIRMRGFQGSMVFTDRKKIEPHNWSEYLESNGEWRSSYKVSHPFSKNERKTKVRMKSPARGRGKIS